MIHGFELFEPECIGNLKNEAAHQAAPYFFSEFLLLLLVYLRHSLIIANYLRGESSDILCASKERGAAAFIYGKTLCVEHVVICKYLLARVEIEPFDPLLGRLEA